MEEIKLSPEELKKAIEFGKLIGDGFFSKVFTYKGRLIKMDKELYNLLKYNDPRVSKDVVKDHYKWDVIDFNDRDQIKELSEKQHLIRPKVPEGIITLKDVDGRINGVSPGIIIPEFKDYNDFNQVSKSDYKRLLILLRKIFDDLRNLADNQISNDDLFDENEKDSKKHHFNILQKGNDPQIIDMSGRLVTVGKSFVSPEEMYREFAKLLNYYYRANGLEPIYDIDDSIDEQKLSEMITELDKQTRKK